MADPRFFDARKPLSIAEIETLTGARIFGAQESHDNPVRPGLAPMVADVAPLDRAGPTHLVYCDRPAFLGPLKASGAHVCLTTAAMAPNVPRHFWVLTVKSPALAFAQVAAVLYPDAGSLWARNRPSVHAIDPSAVIGEDTIVAPGCFIGAQAEIGRNTVIGPGCVIGRGVTIGNDCQIGPNVTIGFAHLGDRVVLHAGVCIGGDGFGFTPGPKGLTKIPQLGRVIVQDDCEIGANSAVDRGALADTVIGEGTKIDNLCQIAHNVRIGRSCAIAAQTGISGSAILGDFVTIGGQVGVADHIEVGSQVMIAGKSGVSHDLPGGGAYGGFPARPIRQWRREVASLARLGKKKLKGDERTDT